MLPDNKMQKLLTAHAIYGGYPLLYKADTTSDDLKLGEAENPKDTGGEIFEN